MRKLLTLALAGLLSWATAGQARADVRLGVIAPRGEAQATAEWGEFARYLEAKIGQPVKLVPVVLARMGQAIAGGELDYALCNPVQSVAVHQTQGAAYLASLVTTKGAQFGGVILANPKSGIVKASDLKGKKVIGLSKNAAGAYLFQAYELKQQGLNPPADFASYAEAKKQDDAILAVKAGLMDAAFVRTGVLEDMIAEGKVNAGELTVVDAKPGFPEALSTELYPEWYLLAVNKAAAASDAKVKAAVLALPADSPAAKAAGIKGFQEPVDSGLTSKMMQDMKVPPFDK